MKYGKKTPEDEKNKLYLIFDGLYAIIVFKYEGKDYGAKEKEQRDTPSEHPEKVFDGFEVSFDIASLFY